MQLQVYNFALNFVQRVVLLPGNKAATLKTSSFSDEASLPSPSTLLTSAVCNPESLLNMRGGPKPLEFPSEKIVYLLLHGKLQSPSKYSPFDAIRLLRHFSHCSKQFLNSSILMPFSVSVVFCFTSSISKTFPFEGFFSLGK